MLPVTLAGPVGVAILMGLGKPVGMAIGGDFGRHLE